MIRLTVCRAVLCAAAILILAPTARADFEAGQRAWEAGDSTEALAQWSAAADEGDPRSMLALGRLYREGLGVLQDYVEAYKWFNVAASRGNAEAASERNDLSARMTPEQLAEGQSLARTWRPGAGQGSGPAEPAPPSPETASPSPAPPDAIREGEANAAPAPPEDDAAAGPPPPRAIREAQRLMAGLGYEPGPADGVWGARTARAYRSFLRDRGLPQVETLTPNALRAMRAATTTGAEAPRLAASPDALHRTAQAGDIDGLRAALTSGAEVNARDGQGWTALMHAVNQGYPVLVEPLLAAGADVDMRAPDGATALFMAAAHGHSEIVVQLMKAGADVSVPGPTGKTPVDVARLQFGDAGTARDAGMDPTIIALLEGKTWALARAVAEEGERLARQPAGKEFRDCAACPEMVEVPAGWFMMGAPEGEEDYHETQGPVHRVEISKPFAVGKHEVTFAEFDACVSAVGCGYRPGDSMGLPEVPGWGRGTRPVINVSWDDAQSYVAWLSGETGAGYRLLSESEWEYAARAGTRGPFHFGSTISTYQANYHGDYTYGSGHKGVYRNETVPVGSFPANGFGLHDMHGNVLEWVEDCWHDSYSGAPTDGSAWTTGGDCSVRVLRGGSLLNRPGSLRSAYRGGATTGRRGNYSIGFRVARTLTP